MEVRLEIDKDTYLSIPFRKPLSKITKLETTPIKLVRNGKTIRVLCGNFNTFGAVHGSLVSLGSLLITRIRSNKLQLKDFFHGVV